MECHLFCHNEIPMLVYSVPVIGAAIGFARAWLRRKFRRRP
jgi:hypothetical protein